MKVASDHLLTESRRRFSPGTNIAVNALSGSLNQGDIISIAGVNGVNNNFGELPMAPAVQLVKMTNGTHYPSLEEGTAVTWMPASMLSSSTSAEKPMAA